MSDTPELKPCPWCGEKPEVAQTSYSDDNRTYFMHCLGLKCRVGPRTNLYVKKSAAIAAWNSYSPNSTTGRVD